MKRLSYYGHATDRIMNSQNNLTAPELFGDKMNQIKEDVD